MKILVIGATGRTGRLLVEQALGHGHHVRAFARAAFDDIPNELLEVIQGDGRDFDAVLSAAQGVSAIAVTVGGGRDATVKGLHEAVVANAIHALATTGASRLAILSAIGAFNRDHPHISAGYRLRIATIRKAAFDDLEAAERRVMASDLDWTIVRPSGLSDDAATGHYRVTRDGSIPARMQRIARADVAAVMLKALETDTYRRTVVTVSQ